MARFFRSPLQMGSITPSSAHLVRAILDPIPWERVNAVVELGAGTGVVTRELQRRLPPGTAALIFEKDPTLQQLLRGDHPDLHHESDAEAMRGRLSSHGIDKAECIVSGLPFVNFPRELRTSILDQARDVLTPDGIFIAYQYTLLIKPLLLERFRRVETRFVLWNLPPAFVYVCQEPIRQGEMRAETR